MKTAKKLFALLLAVMTVMALSATALAAETFTIRFTDPGFSLFAAGNETPRYSVYQIFTGDVSTDDSGVKTVKTLSNIKWGKNCAKDYTTGEAVSEDVLNALIAVKNSTDTAKLEKIKNYVDLTGDAFDTTDGEDLPVDAGYYLIKDNGPVGNSETYSLYLVEVTDNVTITPKTSNTTPKKSIVDNGEEKESADYDIGDEISFQLSAIITENYDYYESYKLTFHDTLSDGLTFDASSVTVKVGDTEITSGYEVVTTGLTDECSFHVQFEDLRKIDSVKAGSEITVEYTATLNKGAVIGDKGNTNTLKVSYSNNPYNKDDTTYTPDVTVTVYTYKIVVNKVDGDNEPLAGAGFTLRKKDADGNYQAVGDEVKGDNMTQFTFSGLGSGDYKLEETTTPEGYNTIPPIEFTISATYGNGGSIATLSAKANDDTEFTADNTAGSLTTTVINERGSLLPETGGIGTTIFYVLGGILMAGAVVLLVTRKRMRDAE